MAINVFLSVGRPFNADQEGFIANIEQHLQLHGLRPRTVGRNEFTHKQPLKFVADLMDRSAGALIIALERISIEKGFEKRGTSEEKSVSNSTLSTPWNQIEAALAYSKKIPILVIREHSVRPEGLLEGRYDWFVHATALNPSYLKTAEFGGTFQSWRREVARRAGWFGCRN